MKRTAALIICIVMLLCCFSEAVSAELKKPLLPEVNVVDSRTDGLTCTDVYTGEAVHLYSEYLPEGGALVVISVFGHASCVELVQTVNGAEWLGNSGVKVAIVCSSDLSASDFESVYGDLDDNIAVLCGNSVCWSPITTVRGYVTIYTPFTSIVTKEDGNYVIRYAEERAVPLSMITNSIAQLVSSVEGDENFYLTDITVVGTRLYEEAHRVFELVNQERESAGLPPLSFNARVTELAMRRAAECQVSYSHTRANGMKWSTINEDSYYSAGFLCAENIAYGYSNADQVMTGWMNSTGHRANILHSSAECIGIGAIASKGGIAWVQLFGTKSADDGDVPETSADTEETVEMRYTDALNIPIPGHDDITLRQAESFEAGLITCNNLNLSWGSCWIKPIVMTADPAIAAYDSDKGIITALSPGRTSATVRIIEEHEGKSFNITVLPAPASYSISLSLEDSIDINFYIKNVDADAVLEDFEVLYTFRGETTSARVTNPTSNRYLVASCAAKEVGDTVKIQVFYQDEQIKEVNYSVRQYCETVLSQAATTPAQEKQHAVCLAVLDYGAGAQQYFGYNTDDLANSEYTAGDLSEVEIPAEMNLLQSNGNCSGVKKMTVSLALESKTELNFYFTPAEGVLPGDIAVTLNGEAVTEG
ncbi:MAG: CAP domain-containing protein, partial [Clostridia bacterium]|nr:CAP domain-containing protein [Clostridia bacterium]